MRSPDLVNRLLQTVHSNGFSPEELRLCNAWRVLLTTLTTFCALVFTFVNIHMLTQATLG